ncbi:MAG TPA: long-chain fatty acid--CoA ligase [Fimbriimonadaceae bacterium]|nr:long-chain fatty acid--CoA ligase [Fimbriimonadaceae bacterium]
MEAKSLGQMLGLRCARFAGKTAMLAPGQGGFRPISYKELYATVQMYAGAIDSLGLKKGDRLCILSENCPEWAFADWACQTLGIVVVPIYPTLPADQAQYIVKDSGALVLLAGDANQAKKVEGVANLKVMLLKGADSLDELARSRKHMIAADAWEKRIAEIEPEDIATVIYTSGTTGLPKGAMLNHRGFLSVFHSILHSIPMSDSDMFLSFLPMSHVYERTDGQYLPIYLGATIAYAKNLASLANDIVQAKPTVMLVVPRFLEATADKILDGMKKQKPLNQKLFHWALQQGTKHFNGEFAPFYWLTEKLVGKKVRERFGGRLRFFVSGGAALPRHVAEFYGAFGIQILQGYGLTETYSGVCVNHPDRNRPDTVGEVLDSVEVKIADDGEILFRGDARMVGYYNLPKETAEAIDRDGWFHTGDIGMFDGQYLKITDRKKDLLVLGNGKNVAPQPIENKLRSSHYIQEAVVLGDGMDSCVALIVPNFEALRAEIPDFKRMGDDEISRDDEVRKKIRQEIDKVNKTLAGFEMVKKYAILERAFSIESGEMTPSFKVKRNVVKERYSKEIADMKK